MEFPGTIQHPASGFNDLFPSRPIRRARKESATLTRNARKVSFVLLYEHLTAFLRHNDFLAWDAAPGAGKPTGGSRKLAANVVRTVSFPCALTSYRAIRPLRESPPHLMSQ